MGGIKRNLSSRSQTPVWERTSPKLRFGLLGAKRSFAVRRSQTEFGNEGAKPQMHKAPDHTGYRRHLVPPGPQLLNSPDLRQG
jgi:hypothetical protein